VNLEDYEALKDSEDLPDYLRAEYRWRYQQAVKRAELFARIGEEGKRRMAVHKWQQETLRLLHKLFAQQFEVLAWERRSEQKPIWTAEARSRLQVQLKGLRARILRARSEAAGGCELQREWLALHAEIVSAVG
jgi:hypothetical protein